MFNNINAIFSWNLRDTLKPLSSDIILVISTLSRPQ